MYRPGRLGREATLSSRGADSERQGKADGRPRRSVEEEKKVNLAYAGRNLLMQ